MTETEASDIVRRSRLVGWFQMNILHSESVRLRLGSCWVSEWYQLETFVTHLSFPSIIDSMTSFSLSLFIVPLLSLRFLILVNSSLQTLSFQSNWTKNSKHETDQAFVPNSHHYFRFEHNHCTASLGIGGYYKRGYRTHISKAPIRETLAAAIDFNALLSSPSNNNITLLDPFCGSGTLLQEAWSFADGDWPYLQRKRLMPDYVDMLIRKARFVGSDVDLDKLGYYPIYVNLQELGLGRAMQYMYDWIVLLV